MKTTAIMIVGVGGQGTLLTSRILGHVAVSAGLDAKVSEVHGMSQRGGSVVTYVKMGEKVHSPLIEKGEADVLLCFEQLEALRWIDYAKPEADVIVNRQQIDPMPVILGAAKYPEGILEKIVGTFPKATVVPALDMAKACGSMKVVNVVMIGVLARTTGFDKSVWLDAIRANVKPQFLDMNLCAFEAGYGHAGA